LSRPNILEMVRESLPALRRSDRKVAELVLAEPRLALDATVAALASRAGVSQPTVMRFCTAVGCGGYQDFRLRLAHSLALGRTPTHSAIAGDDRPAEVAAKIFDYTMSSLDWARHHLDADALERAVALLAGARTIEFFGFGASGIVARDAQQKFPLFGVPCGAHGDSHEQVMVASMMGPGDVAVAISNTGSSRDIIEVARLARARGAAVIGLCGSGGGLSRQCDLTLLVETLDNTDQFTPTTSRIAALVVVDILSTAVALRRSEAHRERVGAMKRLLADYRRGAPPAD